MSALKQEQEDRTQPSTETIRMIAGLKILSGERREATKAGEFNRLLVINETEQALKRKINGTIRNELWFMNASLYGLKRVSQIYRMMGDDEKYNRCINIGLGYQQLLHDIEEEIEASGVERGENTT